MRNMTPYELKLAIEQAWEHTVKTAPGPQLERAERHLDTLRLAQSSLAIRLAGEES